MSHTNNKEERIEEVVNRLFDLTVDCKLVPQDIRDAFHQELQKAREEERKDAYAHCAIIREREINDILFEVADEARDTFGNGEKVIRRWMQKNNCEIHPLLIEDDQSELDQPNQTVSIYRINIGKGKNIIKDIEFETTVPGTVEVIFTPDN